MPNSSQRGDVPPLPPVVPFGRCEVRRDTREVLLDGQVQRVRRRVFDLIAYLIRHRPRTVPHAELLEVLWQRRKVSPSVVARAVMEARRALGETAGQDACIVSVHGVGYRFAAQIGVLTGLAAKPTAPDAAAVEPASDDPVAQEADAIRALLQRSRDAHMQRRYGHAQALAEAALRRATALGSHAEQVRALLRCSAAALQTGHAPDAARLVADAMRIAKAEGHAALLAEVRVEAGSLHCVAGELDTAVRHLRDALEVLGGQPGHEADAIRCMNWLSVALGRSGDLDGALQVCRRSIQASAAQQDSGRFLLDRLNEVRFLASMGDRDAALGQHARARACYEEGLSRSADVLRDVGAPDQRSLWLTTMSNRALLLERLGRLGDAWAATRQYDEQLAALPPDQAHVGQGNRPLILMQRARLLARSGALVDAMAQAAAALRVAEESHEQVNEMDELYREAAAIAEQSGDLAMALKWLRACNDALLLMYRGRAASLAAVLAAEMNADELQASLDATRASEQAFRQEAASLRLQLEQLQRSLPLDPGTGMAGSDCLESAFGPAHTDARIRELPMCLGVLTLQNARELEDVHGRDAVAALWRQAAETAASVRDLARPAVDLGGNRMALRVCNAGPARAQAVGHGLVSLLQRPVGRDAGPAAVPRWHWASADAVQDPSVQHCIDRLLSG